MVQYVRTFILGKAAADTALASGGDLVYGKQMQSTWTTETLDSDFPPVLTVASRSQSKDGSAKDVINATFSMPADDSTFDFAGPD